ncbi:MAG: single-stranded DNA-binding protein, partial [Desulfosarcina sp.]|nr:single-stranded DNA-binding protein [Desulfosarcina sp.]
MALSGGGRVAGIAAVTDNLVARTRRMTFSAPVTHTYNPLVYARSGYDRYVARFGGTAKQVILVGMNPGPFGMAQTGVPFGDVEMVKGWMGITAAVAQPASPHPKRPISGFSCTRGEVSGRRLWGWAKQRYGNPGAFFKQFFVLNYCPMVFMEASGRNRTPDKLPAVEKKRLFQICDQALRKSIEILKPQWVVGIGGFAEKRAQDALNGMGMKIGRITHPSPANPKANR